MRDAEPRELLWQVNGLLLAGLSWGEAGAKPLLALHGWLDNAASFALLAPLLEGYHVVALDLSGHGHSDHRSADASYQIWDDLPEIEGVIDALGWDTFYLLGHSRGASIACLLASAIPERVQRLVLLDSVAPQPVAEDKFAAQMRKFLQDKRHWQGRKSRVFSSVESAMDGHADRGLPGTAARLLLERNLRACPDGYRWTTDPRLRGASAVKLTAGHIQAMLQALTMPVLVLLAERGLGQNPAMIEQAERHIARLQLSMVPGGHHFHMEPCVSKVSEQVLAFLNR